MYLFPLGASHWLPRSNIILTKTERVCGTIEMNHRSAGRCSPLNDTLRLGSSSSSSWELNWMTNVEACRLDYGTGLTVHVRLAGSGESASCNRFSSSSPPRLPRARSSDLDSLASLCLFTPCFLHVKRRV